MFQAHSVYSSSIDCDFLRNENFDVVYKPNPSLDELSILVSDIDGWLIRSGTKVTKELLENANNLQIIGRAGVGTDTVSYTHLTLPTKRIV